MARPQTYSLNCSAPALRFGWQHDDRQPTNPATPGVMPQKVPSGL
jgi:hypothetical protein